jgi:hypothetical protein
MYDTNSIQMKLEFYLVGFDVLTASTEEYGLLGCNGVLFGQRATFQRNLPALYPGSKSKQRRKRAETGEKLRLAYLILPPDSAGYKREERPLLSFHCLFYMVSHCKVKGVREQKGKEDTWT